MCYFSDAKNTIVFTPLGLVVLEGGGSRSRAPAALAEGLTMPPASKPRPGSLSLPLLAGSQASKDSQVVAWSP